MSAAVMQAVLASKLQPTGVRMVALCLAWHVNEDTGQAWPGRALLAREAGVTPDYAGKVLRGLERDHVIESVVRGGSSDGRKWVSRYRFTAEWLGVWRTGVLQNRGSVKHTTGVLENCQPGFPSPPRKDERKASPSLSSKGRRSRAPGAPRGRTVAPAAPGESFGHIDYREEL